MEKVPSKTARLFHLQRDGPVAPAGVKSAMPNNEPKKLTTVESLKKKPGNRQLGTYTVTLADENGTAARVVVFVSLDDKGEISASHNFTKTKGHDNLRDATEDP